MDAVTETRWATRWARQLSQALLAVLMAVTAPCARAAAAPQPAAEAPMQVTIAQLQQFLSAREHLKDAKLAAQLAGLELTERPGSARLAGWLQQFPGARTRKALTALADLSAFQELPPADLPAGAAPDPDTQRQIFARAVDYVARMRPTLPNFSALRSTTRFEIATRSQVSAEAQAARLFSPGVEKAVYEALGRVRPGPDGGQWLFFAASSASPVTYRDGHEVSAGESDAPGQQIGSYQAQFSTSGEFGPILLVVLKDVLHGKVEWSHWEPGREKPLAVFRYAVPADASNYAVSDSSSGQASFPAYHGEIAIDPESGAILRIMLFADTSSTDLAQSGIVVDYGPVEIAGKTYTCPLRSIALSRASARPAAPPQTFLNDVAFTNYHLFRSEVRIVPQSSAP